MGQTTSQIRAWQNRVLLKSSETYLRRYGLRVEDFMGTFPDEAHAVELLEKCDPIQYELRMRRIQELLFKKMWLPAEAQAAQTPFKPYLEPYMRIAHQQEAERESYR